MYDPTKVAFVDCETLGLNPDVHPIWEIAIILPDTEEEYVWQVSLTPQEIRDADPVALRINGFEDRYDPITAKRRGTSAIMVRDLLTGRHIVGAVPSFDEERLRREHVEVFGWPNRFPWHYHVCDVEAMAVGYLAGLRAEEPVPDVPLPWDSTALGEMLGVEPTPEAERHTALGDARWARRMYEAIVGGPE